MSAFPAAESRRRSLVFRFRAYAAHCPPFAGELLPLALLQQIRRDEKNSDYRVPPVGLQIHGCRHILFFSIQEKDE
ncbi:hypothetical protein, partial [Klebsiella pneumoniae]|uniref:hypothetical protein n=1 Tax=Klebsiella pneumoniae TaxID=573 RepID=UPI0024DE91FD